MRMEAWKEINAVEKCIADTEEALADLESKRELMLAVQESTMAFLAECSKAKIKKVCIGVRHNSLPHTVSWPFEAEGNVFSDDVDNKEGWPAIWDVTKHFGYDGGCGNANQYSLTNEGEAQLADGAYHFKAGKWNRISS